jgi:hypothetical protein
MTGRNPSGIPYFSQWESPTLAPQFIARELPLQADPLWRNSGAASAEEYGEWANHICGMACLKMILAARTGTSHPTLELTRTAVEFGAYVVEDGTIRGMIYAPFVAMLRSRFGIDAEVVTGITAPDLARTVRPGALFIASVHPSIRWLKGPPPKTGGHLVLVTKATPEGVVFHNPSGDTEQTQVDVAVTNAQFAEFFAGRGVLVRGQGELDGLHDRPGRIA